MKVYVLTWEAKGAMWHEAVAGVTASVERAKQWLEEEPCNDVRPLELESISHNNCLGSVKGTMRWNHFRPDAPRVQDPDFVEVKA